ncbi:hypothetical protein [Adhaeretor mobilis]|uniref:hypothetical protein n=1 Tax=Adhaeretor mobilis TaxID=1930276 RepID=UPI00119CCC23|nr:hypothetical protein [Adhaeretor mobilis]
MPGLQAALITLGIAGKVWQGDRKMPTDDYDQLQAKKHDAHPIVRQIIDRDCHGRAGTGT